VPVVSRGQSADLQQPKKATVSDLWATIPSARRDALPQMKRDYQALALANSLDPKRFMKGGAKATKVPESFAVSFSFPRSSELSLIADWHHGGTTPSFAGYNPGKGYAIQAWADCSKLGQGRGYEHDGQEKVRRFAMEEDGERSRQGLEEAIAVVEPHLEVSVAGCGLDER
jgi:hypothetical protein